MKVQVRKEQNWEKLETAKVEAAEEIKGGGRYGRRFSFRGSRGFRRGGFRRFGRH